MASYLDPIEAQLDGATVRCTYFVQLDFVSEVARLWPGFGPIELGGHRWDGIGNLGTISAIRASTSQAIAEVTASLLGDESTLALLAEDIDETLDREMRVYRHFFDIRQTDAGANWTDWAPLGGLEHMFRGVMGPPKVSWEPAEPGETSRRIVSVSGLDPLVNARRPSFSYWSDRDQQGRSPGDNLFTMMSRVTRQVAWPSF